MGGKAQETRMQPAGASESRLQAADRLLDAAERLMISDGYAHLTTRKVAREAGVNHGLVHYYFGSMEELLVQVLERFTSRLVERQRAMYAEDRPFIEKWRTAWDFQENDRASGYSKIWLELQALAWNRPDLRARVAQVDAEWRTVLTEAFAKAIDDYGIADRFPVDAVVSLVTMMSLGSVLERLADIDEGHDALLGWIDDFLQTLEAGAPRESASNA